MTPIEKEIVLAYAKNNMNACKTAREVHYHHNNVKYHLSKIHDKYGLDPRVFYDLVKLVEIAGGANNGLTRHETEPKFSCGTCRHRNKDRNDDHPCRECVNQEYWS